MNAFRSIRPVCIIGLFLAGAGVSPAVQAQFNPLSAIGSVVTTAADARTKDDVTSDLGILTDAKKRLFDDSKIESKGISLLVFGRHVVAAGAVKDEEMKKRITDLMKQDKRIRSFNNELVVVKKAGDDGSFVGDTVIEEKINATLTATKGVSSINMRWKSVNGTVVLMGVARTKDEAALAVKEARGVGGVKSVKSYLRVVPAKS